MHRREIDFVAARVFEMSTFLENKTLGSNTDHELGTSSLAQSAQTSIYLKTEEREKSIETILTCNKILWWHLFFPVLTLMWSGIQSRGDNFVARSFVWIENEKEINSNTLSPLRGNNYQQRNNYVGSTANSNEGKTDLKMSGTNSESRKETINLKN